MAFSKPAAAFGILTVALAFGSAAANAKVALKPSPGSPCPQASGWVQTTYTTGEAFLWARTGFSVRGLRPGTSYSLWGWEVGTGRDGPAFWPVLLATFTTDSRGVGHDWGIVTLTGRAFVAYDVCQGKPDEPTAANVVLES